MKIYQKYAMAFVLVATFTLVGCPLTDSVSVSTTTPVSTSVTMTMVAPPVPVPVPMTMTMTMTMVAPPPMTMTMTMVAPPPMTMTMTMVAPPPMTMTMTMTMTMVAPPPMTMTMTMVVPPPMTMTMVAPTLPDLFFTAGSSGFWGDAVGRAASRSAARSATRTAATTVPNMGSDQSSGGDDSVAVTAANTGGALVYNWVKTNGAGAMIAVSSTDDTDLSRLDATSDVELYKNLVVGGQLWVAITTDYADEEVVSAIPSGCNVGETTSGSQQCRYVFNGLGYQTQLITRNGGEICLGRIGQGVGCFGDTSQIADSANFFGFTARRTGTQSWVILSLPSGTTGLPILVPDTDYRAAGIWVRLPDDDAAAEIGAFADGNDEFDQGNLEGLTGEATYAGGASGVYVGTGVTENTFFNARATLTANFDATDRGTVGGSIGSFTDASDGGNILAGVRVILENAAIGDAAGGFFTGDTTADGGYTGKWGGQFYGNPAASATGADAHPGSAAGTFGASTGSDGNSIVGTFITEKQ